MTPASLPQSPDPALDAAAAMSTDNLSAWRIGIAAACALMLGACATAPGAAASSENPFLEHPPAATTAVRAVPVAPSSLVAPTNPVDRSLAVADSGVGVAGLPTDPLAPEKPLTVGSEEARADLWERIRRGYAMPNLDTALVTEHEQWYANRPDYVARMTERGSRYLYHIVDEVSRRGMPAELALLPFIESAFNPQAMSSARASGMWQFMPATGKDFALKQNMFRDDRRDVLSSTRAALDYLSRLNQKFGDWHLALAAYNWGEGNVQRAIDRNRNAGLGTDYLSLNMPAETRHYVPKLQAVKNIVTQPHQFGLVLAPLQNHPHFLSVPIQRDIDLALAARLAGLSIEEFKTLNPQHNKPVILAAGTPQILLPYDNADRFVKALPAHRGQLATWTAWVVPRTMKSSQAAQEAGMSEEELRDINRIPARMMVRAGSTLLVQRHDHRHTDVSVAVADNAHMQLTPEPLPFKRITFRARRGDTVASVSRQYRLNPADVARLNGLGANGRFKLGQAVALQVPSGTRGPARAPETAQASSPDQRAGTALRARGETRSERLALAHRNKPSKERTARLAKAEKSSSSVRLARADKPAGKRLTGRTLAAAGKPGVARASRLAAGTAGRMKVRRD
jgi:membrane-bound lytic murein transglycosylase D